ncbi:MAG: hypothetical protein DSY77_07820 [Bacteroidetes bacterium]|nr:MAG: hypothetical protein DSY77_07820 [Bacteroidota bacterium]
MKPLIENHELELKYKEGNGAWTYHLIIPNTANIEGKWGSLKVSGWIDNYKIEELNLAPLKNQDKMISINKEIRKSIGKSAGEMVNVTLSLKNKNQSLSDAIIRESFNDAGVLKHFQSLNELDQSEILTDINSMRSEDNKIEKLNDYINRFLSFISK